MPVHFAAARSAARSPIARALARKATARAANDNGDPPAAATSFDTMMRSALQHFAEHGLGAAGEARRMAENAHFAGDEQGYRWWLGVCRTLDRRMAVALDRHVNAEAQLIL